MATNATALQKERKKFRLFSLSGAVLMLGIVALSNFVLGFVPLRLDLSQGRVYSLSKGSKNLLSKIDDRLVVKVMFSSELPPVYKLNEKFVTDLLMEYQRASHGKISLEFIDPGKSPEGKRDAITNGVAPVQLDVRERDRREVKECFMGVSFLYGDKRESIPVIQDTGNLEYEISACIKRLIDPTKPFIGIVKAGEALTFASKSLESLAAPVNQLYNIQEIDLASPVSPTIKALWWIGPSAAPTEAEINNLRAYLKAGGTLGLLFNRYAVQIDKFLATPATLPSLETLLSELGLSVSNALVVDPQCDRIQVQSVTGMFRMINVIDYPYFPWASDLDRNNPAMKNLDGVTFPFVSPVTIASRKPGLTYAVLAQTSGNSYLDEKAANLNPLASHEAPLSAKREAAPVMVSVEGLWPGSDAAQAALNKQSPTRVLVAGCSRAIQTDYPSRPTNFSMFINLVDWSVQDQDLIQIRSRGMARRPLKDMSDGIRTLLKYATIFLLPLISLILGLAVWRRQKVRRAMLPLVYREA